MKRPRLFFISLLLVGAARSSHAIDVAGVNVANEAQLAAQKVVLNGAGVHHRFGFEVYVCALYLPQKRSTVPEILGSLGPKRVSVTTLREISSGDLSDAMLTGLRHNSTADETRNMGVQLVKLGELFSAIPRLRKGDNFTIDYEDGVGTIFSVNGKPALEPLPDKAFFDAMLRIWLGENPADSGLKTRLLGLQDEPPQSNPR